MSLDVQLIDQRVEGLVDTLGDRFRSELGIANDPDKLKSAAFVVLVAKTLLDLDDDGALDAMVEGGGDFGIDAVYFTAPENGEFQVTLIQGKYKRALDGDSTFPESGIVKMFDAIRTIFNPAATYTANKRLQQHVEDLRSLIRAGHIPQVRVVLGNNGLKWNAACQQRIENSGLGASVSWDHAGPENLISLMRAPKPVETRIQLTGRAIVEDYPYMRAMIGRMSVLELARLFDQFGDVLLQRNIRRYLGLTVRTNKEITETLRDPEQRQKFYFYNNGITITCKKFGYNPFSEKDWVVQVSGLQIVNGGQTSKTIQQMMRELGTDIAPAQIMVRIYELPEDDEDLVQRITRATNSQSPVDLRDLRSNDPLQKRLGESIQELGFSYRRQRSDSTPSPNDITSATVAEAVLAVWRNRPHQARFLTTEHFGKLYNLIFTDRLNGAQAVIAVLLLRIAENKRKRPPPGSPDFLQYGSRFIAMAMGKHLMIDLETDLAGLTHRNFAKARDLIEAKGEVYFQNALGEIGAALAALHHGEDISLQKLSATFRRYDLVERLREGRPLSLSDLDLE
jgi:hypothetical protein